MRKFVKSAIVGAALALSVIGVAQAADQDPILIGVQVPTTGASATYGKSMLHAVQIAATQLNDNGGVLGRQVELAVGDAACDPQQSVNAASKLASQGVAGVVGGYCSGATLPTLDVYGDANIPFVIAASNSTKLIPANPGNAFMINSTGADQAKKAVSFLASQGIENLAIINQGDAYSQNLANLTADLWKEKGHKVPVFATTGKGQTSYASLVTKIRSSGADAVFWTAYYADAAKLIRQLRRGGYQGLIAMGDGSNSPKLFDLAGGAAEGVYVFSNPIAKFLPEAQAFIKAFKKRFDTAPGPYAPLAYDSMMLLADAMERAGTTDPDAVIKALAATKNFDGIAGDISFTDKNTLAKSNFIVLEGHDGHWVLPSKK